MSWYDDIRKPSWAPPSSLFSIAWTVIYICYALFGVLLALNRPVRTAILVLYGAGWALNLLWIPLFRQSTSVWSAVWIGMLLVQVLVLTALSVAAGGALRWGSLLLLPYAVWLSLALALSASIAHMN